MGKLSKFLDGVFGFQGRKAPGNLAVSIATDPILQRDETRVQPYGLEGPKPSPHLRKPPVVITPVKPKAAIVKNDLDILQTLRKRAEFNFAITTGNERTADITSQLEGVQPPSNLTDALEEDTIANLRLIPSAGFPNVLDARDAILSGNNRRLVKGTRIRPPATWQELLQQATFAGNAPVVPAVPPGASLAEANAANPLSLIRGDSRPKSFYEDESKLANKGKGIA